MNNIYMSNFEDIVIISTYRNPICIMNNTQKLITHITFHKDSIWFFDLISVIENQLFNVNDKNDTILFFVFPNILYSLHNTYNSMNSFTLISAGIYIYIT